jgi:RNA polymerase sigma-70 factor (ECF subfamily)
MPSGELPSSGWLTTGAGSSPESTADLLRQAGAGSIGARDALIDRYLPRLRRWARGRLPHWARGLADTQDLVQDVLVRAFQRIERFEDRGDGAFFAYLRQALLNRVREEIRRAGRRPAGAVLLDEHADAGVSPLERAIGRQGVERYEHALARLRPHERQAVIMRIEFGHDYAEIAVALGSPTANAARSVVTRALRRLVDEMHDDGTR